MKLLAFSDIHLDAVTAGRARRDEVLHFLERVYEIAVAEKVDVVIFAGDAHDPERALAALYTSDLLRRFFLFTQGAKKPIKFIAVAGNHDVVDTSELYLGSPVTTLTPLRAAANALCGEDAHERILVFDRPFVDVVTDQVSVLGLPYVSRAHASRLEGWDRHALDTAADHRKRGKDLIVIGHRVIPGARMGSESVEMARGQDQLFPAEEVAKLKPRLTINGHYHMQQIVRYGDIDILIPGSPLRFTFGEVEQDQKGVCIVELLP